MTNVVPFASRPDEESPGPLAAIDALRARVEAGEIEDILVIGLFADRNKGFFCHSSAKNLNLPGGSMMMAAMDIVKRRLLKAMWGEG